MGVHDEFTGVIGRDWRDSTPAWPPSARARPPVRPTWCYVVLDDVGFAQLGCYGSMIDTPNIDALAASGRATVQLPHHRAVLADPVVPAHRAQPPLQRHGPRRRPGHGLPGLLGRGARARTASSPRSCAPQGYSTLRGRQVAPHARRRDAHGRRPQQLAARPRLRPLVRLPRRRDAPVRAHALLRQPLGAAAAHGRPRATTSPRTWSTTPSSTSATSATSTASSRSSSTSRTGACHSPHHAPPEWIERYRGAFDDGWDALRERVLARQLESGVVPPGHRAVAASAVGAGLGRARARGPDGRGAVHGVLRRLPLAHRRPDRPAARAPRRRAATPTTRSWSSCPTTAPAPRAARTGSINDVRLVNRDPAGRTEMRARIDELGGPSLHNNYPWGWTMAGNTPFKRWKREVHEGGVADPCIVRWPARFAGDAGADPPPVRARHRRAADGARARSASTRPTRIRGSGAEPDPRHELRLPPRQMAATTSPARHTTQHFEMLGSRALYHDGWKAVTFKPLGPHRRRSRTRSWRRSTTTCGSCTTSPTTRRRCTTSPRRSRSGWRA